MLQGPVFAHGLEDGGGGQDGMRAGQGHVQLLGALLLQGIPGLPVSAWSSFPCRGCCPEELQVDGWVSGPSRWRRRRASPDLRGVTGGGRHGAHGAHQQRGVHAHGAVDRAAVAQGALVERGLGQGGEQLLGQRLGAGEGREQAAEKVVLGTVDFAELLGFGGGDVLRVWARRRSSGSSRRRCRSGRILRGLP